MYLKPVRVAHLIGSTGIYGAERWILAQLRYLDRRETHASLINLVDRPGERSRLVSEAQKQGHDAEDFYTGGRFNPIAVLRLAKMIRERRFTVLHSHGYKSDIIGLSAGRLSGTKTISTPHGWSKSADKKVALYEKIDRLCLRFFDYVCPLSSGLYEGLYGAGIKKSRLKLIMNGVDIQEIDETWGSARTNGKKRIGYIGQFIEGKSLEDLIDAFFRLHRDDCELYLIGDGPCRERLFRYVEARNGQSRVYFTGYSVQRLQQLKSFDVFVLPSLSEGLPRCIMEAHAAKVPVVATDIEGVRPLVNPNDSGLLVPPRDRDALAKAINRVLNSPESARRLADRGRQIIEERFSAATMAAQYQKLYLSFSNSPQS
jgi:glycosyltransferase involved in cell wall biosynthesis